MRYDADFLDNHIIREDMQMIYQSSKAWDLLERSGIYITGATGMIASYFVMFLIFLNEVYGSCIEIYAGIRSVEKARRRFGKYCDREYLHLICSDINAPLVIQDPIYYIVHAASLASPQYYGKMPVETMLPNVIGTCELLKYGAKNPLKGFLFFSSGSVYGSVGKTADIVETTVGSMDWMAAGNVYGESKRCGEAMCSAYFREYGVPVKIARIHHTYGPTMDVQNDKRVFAEFANNILNNNNIVLKSDGEDKRAFCYLGDTTAALFQILLNGEAGECYNVGNPDQYVSIRELAELLTGVFPEKGLRVEFQKREDAGYCASPVRRMTPVNVDKLKELGWNAKVTVADGFTRSLQYLSEMKDG